jgi:hypothetical protein
MLSLYITIFIVLVLTHGVTCAAGYYQGLSLGKMRGRLEEKREHVNFLKELDNRLDSQWDSVIEETPQKNWKELN